MPKSRAAAYRTAKRKSQPIMTLVQCRRLEDYKHIPLIARNRCHREEAKNGVDSRPGKRGQLVFDRGFRPKIQSHTNG